MFGAKRLAKMASPVLAPLRVGAAALGRLSPGAGRRRGVKRRQAEQERLREEVERPRHWHTRQQDQERWEAAREAARDRALEALRE